MNYGQRFVTLYSRQGSRLSPWKRNAEKQNGCQRRPYKLAVKRSEKQKRKGKIFPSELEFQSIARRGKKVFLSDEFKEIEENNRM